ncbi:retrovirus-related Pol polyprotein from transposon 17.6 [Trichonephila clavipes]|nr:retrovirus-related Pol polyprotein from transposon 17.6 [Trichonephila clavipes]
MKTFRNRPGKAKVKGRSVKVTADSSPKKLQPYRVPIALQKEVEHQVNELLDMHLIEHSDSDWVHPMTMWQYFQKHGQITCMVRSLKVFLRLLREVKLDVNLEKCDFGKSQVKFLGHVVGSRKHTPDPQKVETMSKLPRPTTKRQL